MDAFVVDEYALTQGQAMFMEGHADDIVTFELFIRRLPAHRDLLIACGQEQAAQIITQMVQISGEEAQWMRAHGYAEEFIQRMHRGLHDQLAITRVRALPEGQICGPNVPIMQVTGPRLLAQLVESPLLATVGLQTMIASKAARIVHAAEGRKLSDFSLRRQQGLGHQTEVARAAYIAGFDSTATVSAGMELGIPTTGTMAHHWVTSWGEDREQEAFESFLRAWPSRSVLLVDSYDTMRGIDRAIAASQATGIAMQAIRIDSGDLAQLARAARQKLDEAGCEQTGIILTGDLDEYSIAALIEAEVPCNGFGVGTRIGVSEDAPSMSIVYKLVEQHEIEGLPRYVAKRSPGKVSLPGAHDVFRDPQQPQRQIVGMHEEHAPGLDQLLRAVLVDGELLPATPLQQARERACEAQQMLSDDVVMPPVPELLPALDAALQAHMVGTEAEVAKS